MKSSQDNTQARIPSVEVQSLSIVTSYRGEERTFSDHKALGAYLLKVSKGDPDGVVKMRDASMANKCAEVQAMVAGITKEWGWSKFLPEALKIVRWRLRGLNGEFVGLGVQYQASFVPESEALIFGADDNPEIKLAFFQTLLGPLTVEVIKPCAS